MSETLSVNKNELLQRFPALINKYFNKDIVKIKYLGGGSFGKAFAVKMSDDNTVVLKAYRLYGMNESEKEQLEFLSKNTNVSMPEVLFCYSDTNICVLCMTIIKGRNVLNPVFLFKSKKQKEQFANSVVDGMLSWHSVKNTKFGDLTNPRFETWKKYYREQKVESILNGLKNLAYNVTFSKKKYKILINATKLFDEQVDDVEEAVLIHGDLNIMNIMANPKDFSLTGFIDPCGSMWADREYDLFQLENMWGNKFKLYETYKNKYPHMSKNCDFKIAYYGLMNEVSCRLSGGKVFPIWEDLWFRRMKNIIKGME